MNFRDISQFTSPATYHVNVPLDYLAEQINRYTANGLQLNPNFQRGHVWTEAQQIAYVEYMLRGGTSGREIYFNLPGLEWGEKEFVCVDGLQRITACLRFMDNEIPAFGTLYKDYDGRIDHQVNLSIWVNTLKTKREVLIWYMELNSGGTAHTESELDRVRDMIEREHKTESAEGEDNTKPPCTENCTSCLDTGCIFHETNRDTDEYKEMSRELRSRIVPIK